MAEKRQVNRLVFFVNGKKVIENNADPECTLLSYLRQKLRLTGTKLGCAEGGCGACTVLLSKFDRLNKKIKHIAVNACLTPVCSVHGMAVTTIEGIGSTQSKLHPVQERIAKAHGSQCGFCTPGIVMSMYALLRSLPNPTMKDLEVAFQGNLCRCTGYRPIIEGYRTFTEEYKCAMGDQCCKKTGSQCSPDVDYKLFEPSEFTPFDPSQEPIFPPELKLNDEYDNEYLVFKNEKVQWFRPTSKGSLLELKKNYNNAKIVVGNTEVGVEVKLKHFEYPILVNPILVKELNSIETLTDGVKIGASVTLMDLQEFLQKLIDNNPEHETNVFKAVVKMLHYFAGKQIRNVASVGGNIMTGSPISDLNPIFMAANAELEVESLDRGLRKIKMDGNFFTAYRRNCVAPDEILVSIFIPKTGINQHFVAFKQAKRRDDDIAIVTGAFNIKFEENSTIVLDCGIAYGGMGPTTILAPKTSLIAKGKKWNSELVEIINQSLLEELPLSASAPGGMVAYRRSLTMSLFFKAYLSISQMLGQRNSDKSLFEEKHRSGAASFHTLTPNSTQLFEKVASDQCATDPIRRPKVHASAFKQATGEAIYCDDIPRMENELYLALVLSKKAHAKIISIDAQEALSMPGVHAFFSAQNLDTHQNQVGPVIHDEEVFIRHVVTSQGQILGAIVAENQKLAQKAARKVKVEYEELSPVIITIEDAIAHKSFFPGYPKVLNNGNVEKAFAEADFVVESSCRMGGQEHFYLETHAAVGFMKDVDELELICSTQHPSEIQKLTAHALGIPASKIVCKAKRLGGGFGGKESRGSLVAIPVAIAAYKLKRPVRIMLDRDEDMLITGTRHPFYFKYKVSCTKEGIITGCDIDIYNNAGYSLDLSFSVLDRAMFHFQNTYRIPNVRVSGTVLKTNLPSNTAFRGFGGPQGMFVGEHIVRDVARVTGKDYVEIQKINMYNEGDLTHFNQKLVNCNIRRCFDEIIVSAAYQARKKSVEDFNNQHRWRKRGISLVNTMFGIAFTAPHLNQSGALVCVYVDGSVLISHGGVEMGQGLHTKMIQVAATTLKIPFEKIHISETSTDKVPNTSPTAASAGSDLNGMAVLQACKTIYDRLAPYREKNPEDGWNKWVYNAYFDRVSLSATGFYITPDLGYDFKTNSGLAFNYYTFGSAVSEVEIDCLTGDHQVLRTDIVMDLGSSLNPAIDIGQIEGAFMQGYGLFTMEEMVYSPDGTIFSRGPGAYKIPGFADIPGEINVSLLTGAPNPRAVYSSKAVGEPPLFLASSVFFAIKEAIKSARKDEGIDGHFDLVSPATCERIRMACQDSILQKIEQPAKGSYVPWNVMP